MAGKARDVKPLKPGRKPVKGKSVTPVPSTPSPEQPFRVVGIGASAGGLEAFEQFFSNMPADSGMAFVIVQHLAPARHSAMPDILSRYTKMPIHEARSGYGWHQTRST